MNHKNIFPKLLILLIAVSVLSACGKSAESNFPTGKFFKSGSAENYGMIFNEDGTFSVFSTGVTLARGTYGVSGDIFTETSNDGGCTSPMEFKYTFDGTNLIFNYAGNPEDDKLCAGRYADFNNVTYTLSE